MHSNHHHFILSYPMANDKGLTSLVGRGRKPDECGAESKLPRTINDTTRGLVLFAALFSTGCAAPDLSASLVCSSEEAKNPPLSSAIYRDDSIGDLKSLASAGDLAAARVIGERYEAGDGVPPNIQQAVLWYRQAAIKPPITTTVYMPGYGKTPGATLPITIGPATPGDLIAMADLGRLYLNGQGVPVDRARGDQLLACAAKNSISSGARLSLQASQGKMRDHG
jgi:TPR repeat protein